MRRSDHGVGLLAPASEALQSRVWTQTVALGVIAVVWIAIAALLAGHDRPPLVDWPNHMARHYLEWLWLTGRPLPPFYDISYAVMPNLGSDLIVPGLLSVLDPVAASKAFVVFAVLLYWAGPVAYVWSYTRHSQAAVVVAAAMIPWLLAGTFFWGFMNYYSGVGLAFLAAANHIRMAGSERVPGWQYLAHAALLVLLYLWHLTSIGIYLVLAGSFMLERVVRAGAKGLVAAVRNELVYVAAMVPALAVMIAVMLSPKLNALAGGAVWNPPLKKLMLAFGYFSAYDMHVDVALMALWALALVLVFRFGWPRAWRIDHVGLSAAAFGLLYLVLPFEVGTTSGADIRMLPPLFFTGMALISNFPVARTALYGLALVALVGIVRQASVHAAWSGAAREANEMSAYFAQAPRQSKIAVVSLDRASKANFQSHLIGWAVPASEAYVSSLFSYAGQQPLQLKRQASEAMLAHVRATGRIDAAALEQEFDYLWLFDPAGVGLELPGHWSHVLGRGAGKLYKLR